MATARGITGTVNVKFSNGQYLLLLVIVIGYGYGELAIKIGFK